MPKICSGKKSDFFVKKNSLTSIINFFIIFTRFVTHFKSHFAGLYLKGAKASLTDAGNCPIATPNTTHVGKIDSSFQRLTHSNAGLVFLFYRLSKCHKSIEGLFIITWRSWVNSTRNTNGQNGDFAVTLFSFV